MKVGYTTGVFDMFHVGHLRILERARQNCDHLIVGVSTDELVQSYKNKTPVIPQEDRAAIVASVRHVDEVVYQTTRDKMAAYWEHKFDIMFVGDDWKGDPLFNEVEKALNEQGASVQYFPYSKGVSSSKLKEVLENIQNNGAGL